MDSFTLIRRPQPPKREEPGATQCRLAPHTGITADVLDILASDDRNLVFTALMAVSNNGAHVTSDETDEAEATLHRVTLPDGSLHERLNNVRMI